MTGYGSTGIDIGKIAGGFGFDYAFGELKILVEYCKSNLLSFLPLTCWDGGQEVNYRDIP